MTVQTRPFDVADHLKDDGTVSAYLALALETNDPEDIAQALGDVVRARGGVEKVAHDAGLSASTLEQALGNPDLSTLVRILAALNLRLTIATASEPVAA